MCCSWLLQRGEVGCGTLADSASLAERVLVGLLPSLSICTSQGHAGSVSLRIYGVAGRGPGTSSRDVNDPCSKLQSPRSGLGPGLLLQPLLLPLLALERAGKGCQQHSSLREGSCATGRQGKEPVETFKGENANHMFRRGSSCRAGSSREAKGAGILQSGWALRPGRCVGGSSVAY